MNNNIVLDASALLALIQEEQGAKVIKPLLKFSIMSTVNIAECLTALQRTGVSPQEALILITDIITTIVPFDIEQAGYVAELQSKVQHKGLSLGDRGDHSKPRAKLNFANKYFASFDNILYTENIRM